MIFHSSLPQINIFIVPNTKHWCRVEDETGKGKDLNVRIDIRNSFPFNTLNLKSPLDFNICQKDKNKIKSFLVTFEHLNTNGIIIYQDISLHYICAGKQTENHLETGEQFSVRIVHSQPHFTHPLFMLATWCFNAFGDINTLRATLHLIEKRNK